MKKRRKPKREFIEINGWLVFEHRAFFSDYLENEVGAKWNMIKRSLFDAGFTAADVNEYRDNLLADFKTICNDNGFIAMI